MVGTYPICLECLRYNGSGGLSGHRCQAYPDGIPVEILQNLVDHREPYDGDGGLVYLAGSLAAQRRADEMFSEEPNGNG